MFDIADHLDELRSWPTDRLRKERDVLVYEQRRLHTKELAVLRVLDERGQVDPTLDAGGDSARTVRDKLETARAIESLPEIAAAAYEGALSAEQLTSVTRFADEDTDAEWARRAPKVAPAELARLARNASKPSTADSRRRYEAHSLRMWWTPDTGMLQLHGQLPDVMGATFEATIQRLTEQMKPATGKAWDSFEHRAADALVSLCKQRGDAEDESPSLAPRPVVQVHVPQHGPAEIAGIPIADSLLEQLRANASTGSMLALARSCSSRESAMGIPAISAGPCWGTWTCTTGRGANDGDSSSASQRCLHRLTRASAARCSKLSHAFPVAGFICSVSRWIVASNVAPMTSGSWPWSCNMPVSGVHHIRRLCAS